MKKIVLSIKGMTCSACSRGLEKYLEKQVGIKTANVNLVLSIATIEYEGISKKDIERFIKEAGFESLGEFKKIEEMETKHWDRFSLILFGILLLILICLSHGFMILPIPNYSILFMTIQLIGTILFLWYGFPILKNGIRSLFHKIPNMDTLVMFSVIFSFLYSLYGYLNFVFFHSDGNLYFESTCMVIYFIQLGRYLELISKDKTKNAIKKLVTITPQNAFLKEKQGIKTVSIDEVQKGDILICRSGDKVAVDGKVVCGKTYVDESFITGESVPVLKKVGSKVIAGSICYDGYIEYEALKIGKDSAISEIIKLVIEATNTKSKIQKLADRMSGYFVPIIILLAFLTFFIQLILGLSFESALFHMITVLVVACPCALGLAVPLVAVISNGLCAKKGLFLRNSDVLEKARNIDTIVFDKTGTLTFGKLNIFKVYNYSHYSEQELLNIVANIEQCSTHPIHNAFVVTEVLHVDHFQTLSGMGITGMINGKKYTLGNEKILLKRQNFNGQDYEFLIQNGCSIVYIVEGEEVIGLIGVRDVIRSDLKETIQRFQKNNIDMIILTGDHYETAKMIATELGIKKIEADLLPDQKADYIKLCMEKGKKVIMVGDGINDAPALVTATIGVSINDGTDIAMDSSDVILTHNDISNLFDLIIISKAFYRLIKQNLFWACFYNFCMIPIAMGLLNPYGIVMTPMLASIAMVFSSLTVVLNSLRLERVIK